MPKRVGEYPMAFRQMALERMPERHSVRPGADRSHDSARRNVAETVTLMALSLVEQDATNSVAVEIES